MKAKWLLVVLAMLLLVFVMTQKKSTQVENVPMSIDSLMTIAPEIVGDTVEFEGVCSHLCKHGGTKAFLVGADTSLVLRCQATPEIGGAFAPDCVGRKLLVKGIVCETRIGEAEVAAMEARQAAADSARRAQHACDTDKKAQGQGDIDSFEAQMADYRAKIEARSQAEGKDYLSFYYIDAIGYIKQRTE